MGELDLNGSRGYFNDLAGQAFDDFWLAYQADNPLDRRNFSLVYRRLVAACVLLNHSSDKVADELMPGEVDRKKRLKELSRRIQVASPADSLSIDACRHFSNDLKHTAKKQHSFDSRPRDSDFDDPGEHDVFCFFMTYNDKAEPVDLCIAACETFHFWRRYFRGELAL